MDEDTPPVVAFEYEGTRYRPDQLAELTSLVAGREGHKTIVVIREGDEHRTHNLKCPTCGEPWIDCPHSLNDTERSALFDADRIETAARAGTVISLLERCSEELARLELVPSSDADDVNALSAARGFVARARNLLAGRFQ
jgi:hypothetical protein